MSIGPDHRFSIAPMMEWTDRHCRSFHRGLTRRARLYTEMITTGAVLRGDRARLLAFAPDEQPVAVQLGGSDPRALSEAARICADFGYQEINLNVGCPSDRVQARRFGACLMAEPELVADLIAAMGASAKVPVTIKCRIGIDDQDGEESLDRFIDAVARGGCRTFILHARKAWLDGLSPKENRDVPPIDHDRVYRMKARRPDLTIIVNGGIGSFSEAEEHLTHVDGVMLGRAAYQDPYILAEVDRRLFGKDEPAPSRLDVLDSFMPYVEAELARGVRLNQMTRHILGLFHGQPRARAFRRVLAENAHLDGAGIDVLKAARDVAAGETRQQAVAAE